MAGITAFGLAALALGGLTPRFRPQFTDAQLVMKIAVLGDAGWVDTGIDAGPGDELLFRASGEVSLQRGNPAAGCGPGGLDLITVQQPIPNENLGALIGKVAQLISTRADEDTGIEVRDEIFVLFPVGPEKVVTVPVKGRLYLGINENVFKDNGGEFTVLVFRRPA
jgi:hypothetical protein